jgi:hypothetical protein
LWICSRWPTASLISGWSSHTHRMESIISFAWSWSSSAPRMLPLPRMRGLRTVRSASQSPLSSKLPFVGDGLDAGDAEEHQLLGHHPARP